MILEFWFEFASTYSYPAAARLAGLSERSGVRIEYRPFLLGPIFAGQGWSTSPFNIYEAKGRYMWRDLERISQAMNLPFRKPSVFPRNGLTAARIATAFEDAPWLGAFVSAVYAANFASDLEIGDVAVLDRILSGMGVEPQHALQRARDPDVKARLRERTEEAERLGIFGSPMARVGDELFWGNDRLDDAFAWAARAGG